MVKKINLAGWKAMTGFIVQTVEQSIMKIDSHHHFWNYDPVEYSWMNEDMGVLKRDFGPSDLKKEINAKLLVF